MIEYFYASLIFHASKLIIVLMTILFIFIVFSLWLVFATLLEMIRIRLKNEKERVEEEI